MCTDPALRPAGAASPGGDRLAWAPASGLGPAPQESHGQMGEPSQGTGEPKWGGTGGPLSTVRNPSSWHTFHLGLGVSRIQRAPTTLKAPQPWLPPTLWPPLTALLPAPSYSGEQAKVGEMLLGSRPHLLDQLRPSPPCLRLWDQPCPPSSPFPPPLCLCGCFQIFQIWFKCPLLHQAFPDWARAVTRDEVRWKELYLGQMTQPSIATGLLSDLG